MYHRKQKKNLYTYHTYNEETVNITKYILMKSQSHTPLLAIPVVPTLLRAKILFDANLQLTP